MPRGVACCVSWRQLVTGWHGNARPGKSIVSTSREAVSSRDVRATQ